MKITERYVIAFKSPNARDGKNILEKSHNWHSLKSRGLKQTLENAFELAEHLGVLNSRDKQKIIDGEINWVEDKNRHWNENEWDIDEYLETEYGFIIRFMECRENFKEFCKRINKN